MVPHLVDIAASLAPSAHLDILVFLGEVAGADEGALLADLEPAYRDALHRAEPLILELARHAPKGRATMHAKIALAKVCGDLELASELEDELDEMP